MCDYKQKLDKYFDEEAMKKFKKDALKDMCNMYNVSKPYNNIQQKYLSNKINKIDHPNMNIDKMWKIYIDQNTNSIIDIKNNMIDNFREIDYGNETHCITRYCASKLSIPKV